MFCLPPPVKPKPFQPCRVPCPHSAHRSESNWMLSKETPVICTGGGCHQAPPGGRSCGQDDGGTRGTLSLVMEGGPPDREIYPMLGRFAGTPSACLPTASKVQYSAQPHNRIICPLLPHHPPPHTRPGFWWLPLQRCQDPLLSGGLPG